VEELSSIALGGKAVSVSDEFFAEASHLILVEVNISCENLVGAYLSVRHLLVEGPTKLERPIRTQRRFI
jgi:hypothetical protein